MRIIRRSPHYLQMKVSVYQSPVSRFRTLLFTGILLAVYSPLAAAPQAHTAARRGAPAHPVVNDRALESDIRARFARSKINADKFQVHVQGGVVTIEGHTDVVQHKGTATRLAHSAGAQNVVNRIEVSQAARDRAAGNLAKGRRRLQVKRGEPRSQGR